MEASSKLTVADLSTKFRSKLDLYKVLSQQSKSLQPKESFNLVQFLFPTYKKCPVTFMKALLNGSKKVSKEFSESLHRY